MVSWMVGWLVNWLAGNWLVGRLRVFLALKGLCYYNSWSMRQLFFSVSPMHRRVGAVLRGSAVSQYMVSFED